jgi:hypothetical protein
MLLRIMWYIQFFDVMDFAVLSVANQILRSMSNVKYLLGVMTSANLAARAHVCPWGRA